MYCYVQYSQNSCLFHYLQKRHILEENNQIEARVSAVEEDLEDMETSDEEEAMVYN